MEEVTDLSGFTPPQSRVFLVEVYGDFLNHNNGMHLYRALPMIPFGSVTGRRMTRGARHWGLLGGAWRRGKGRTAEEQVQGPATNRLRM